MKTVIFIHDRFDTMTTPDAMRAAGLPYTCLCDTEVRRQRFLRSGCVDPATLTCMGQPGDLNVKRQWYMDHCVEMGEWCLMLVDDWLKCTELDGYDAETHDVLPHEPTAESTRTLRGRFSKVIDMRAFVRRAQELAQECDRHGILLGGFAGNTNPMFRARHWQRDVLVDGRAWVVKKSPLRFDQNVQMVDDVCFSAQNIMNGTGTLVNQWVLPECDRYTRGAFGTIGQRLPRKLEECAYLVATYPVVQFADKPGWPAGSHVRIVPRRSVATAIEQSKQGLLFA